MNFLEGGNMIKGSRNELIALLLPMIQLEDKQNQEHQGHKPG